LDKGLTRAIYRPLFPSTVTSESIEKLY
jgi:hypothetical protein